MHYIDPTHEPHTNPTHIQILPLTLAFFRRSNTRLQSQMLVALVTILTISAPTALILAASASRSGKEGVLSKLMVDTMILDVEEAALFLMNSAATWMKKEEKVEEEGGWVDR